MTSLTPAEIHEGIADLLAQIIEVSPTAAPLEARFTEDLGVDSLSMVELVIGIEERFGVRIADPAVAELRTVADAVRLIGASV